MKTGFFEKSPGNFSMMRLIVFIVAVVASVIAMTGTVLLIFVIRAMIDGNTVVGSAVGQLILLIGSALGVIAGSEGIKAIQQRSEVKETTTNV